MKISKKCVLGTEIQTNCDSNNFQLKHITKAIKHHLTKVNKQFKKYQELNKKSLKLEKSINHQLKKKKFKKTSKKLTEQIKIQHKLKKLTNSIKKSKAVIKYAIKHDYFTNMSDFQKQTKASTEQTPNKTLSRMSGQLKDIKNQIDVLISKESKNSKRITLINLKTQIKKKLEQKAFKKTMKKRIKNKSKYEQINAWQKQKLNNLKKNLKKLKSELENVKKLKKSNKNKMLKSKLKKNINKITKKIKQIESKNKNLIVSILQKRVLYKNDPFRKSIHFHQNIEDNNFRHPDVEDGPIKSVLNSTKNQPIFTIIFIRHGEKSPYQQIESTDEQNNSKIKEIKYKQQQLNLTDFGKRTNFIMGMEFYNRLNKYKLVSNHYDIGMNVSASARVVDSAFAFNSGFTYFSKDFNNLYMDKNVTDYKLPVKMHEGLKKAVDKLNNSNYMYLEHQRDFDIKFAYDSDGYNLLAIKDKIHKCKIIKDIVQKDDKEFQERYEERINKLKDLFEFEITPKNFGRIAQTIRFQKDHGIKLPSKIDNNELLNLVQEQLTQSNWRKHNSFDFLSLTTSNLLSKISQWLNHFDTLWIEYKEHPSIKNFSKLFQAKKVVFNFTHREVLVNLLKIFGYKNAFDIVPFSSNIVIEYQKDRKVKVLYNDTTLKIFKKRKLRIDQFTQEIDKQIRKDFKQLCGKKTFKEKL